jgi:hypothetical protein
VKVDAERELLAAVDAVLRGEQFVGNRFAGHGFSGASDIAASDEGASGDFRSKALNRFVRAAKAVNGEHAHVLACRTSAPLLWEQGNADEAIQLERLWNQIARSHGVDVLCGYSASFQGGVGSQIFERICAEHSVVHSR